MPKKSSPPHASPRLRRAGAAPSLAGKREVNSSQAKHFVRAGTRAPGVVAFERSVVSYFVDAADMLGVPKSVAAIYGICFASPEPLAFSDINERLDISSGSISQGLRVLREVGALKICSYAPRLTTLPRQIAEGDATEAAVRPIIAAESKRRDRYEPDLELRKLVLHWLESRLEAQLRIGYMRLRNIVQTIQVATSERTILQMRLDSLITWHEKATGLLPVAKTFLRVT